MKINGVGPGMKPKQPALGTDARKISKQKEKKWQHSVRQIISICTISIGAYIRSRKSIY